MPDRYTVYYVARFDRPFAEAPALNGWRGFAWVRFDTTRDPVVRVQVAISFVDMQGARNNLAAEAKSWDILSVRGAALAAWQRALSRIEISGGTRGEQRQFYTALYHAMLHPNLISDADGRYRGFDGKVHNVRTGRAEYANYSDWDIYRTQIPLIALLAPDRASDIEQSLVDAYSQSGWLPRWPVVNQPSSVMGGDSVDPVIAGGYAFGARSFDVRTALTAMIKGATDTTSPPGYGWYLERPESALYQRLGYIPNLYTTSVSPVPNGASETLEYALDDASIAAFARAMGSKPRSNASYRAQRIGRRSSIPEPGGSRRAGMTARSKRRRSANRDRAVFKRGTRHNTPGWCRRICPASFAAWAGKPRRLRSSTTSSRNSTPIKTNPTHGWAMSPVLVRRGSI